MLGEQKERQRASEAMEKSLDAVLSINRLLVDFSSTHSCQSHGI